MEKPKILVFLTAFHPFVGGAEIAIEEIIKRLQNRFDFYILTARFRKNLPRFEEYGGAKIIRLGIGSRIDKWLLPLFVLLPFQTKSQASPRLSLERTTRLILLAVDIGQGGLAGALYKLFHLRSFLVLNIQYGEGEKRLASGRLGLIKVTFKFLLKQADFITPISLYLLGLAREHGYRGKAEIIPNGVDIEKFKNQNAKFKITNQNSKIIITTSRLVRKNGIDVLIRAVAEVKKQIPDVLCQIIGDGEERKNLELEIRNLGLEENVKLLGRIPHEEIPKYLHKADLFIRPSRSEGMGNSFVEALAAGLPIIGTPVGGITGIIRDGETGLFSAVDNPHDLAEKIMRVLGDSEFAERIVENGQAMVKARFSWDKIVESYSVLFQTKSQASPRLSLEEQRVLMFSQDPHILTADSEAQERMKKYASVFKELHIIVPTWQKKQEFSIGNLYFYPASASSFLMRRLKVFLIGKRLCLSDSLGLITVQGADDIGLIAAFLAHQHRIPFQLQLHTDVFSPFYYRAGWKEVIQYHIAKFLIPRSEYVRVVSERIKDSILRKYDFPKEVVLPKIAVLPIFTDTSKFLSAPRDPKTDDRFKNYSFKMVAVGRFVDKEKNFSMLIEMLRDFVHEVPNALLVLVGEGPDRKKYEAGIRNYGLEKNVILEPWRDDLSSFLKSFDLFLLSSNYEGWGRVVIEAMASGLPVVMTDVGLAGEVVKNGENGVVIPVGDKDALLKACKDLYCDSIKRAAFARAGTEIVRNLSLRSREEYLEHYRKSFE